MKAREFLARKTSEDGFTLRNLIKEPLTADEIRKLATQVGGAEVAHQHPAPLGISGAAAGAVYNGPGTAV